MSEDEQKRILVVDDEDAIRRVICRVLEGAGYLCDEARGGAEALDKLSDADYALVITDLMMPTLSGIELLEAIKEKHASVAVIMLTGVDKHETAVQALNLGAYGYVIKPFEPNELLINVDNALRRRELEAMRDDYEERLEAEVRERTAEVHRSQSEIVMRLLAASEYRDDETGAHIRRIGLFTGILAQRAGWDTADASRLQLAAAMHDVGKVGVPDAVLLKPGKLTDEEFEVIKGHTTIGERILGDSDIPVLVRAREIAGAHHEKWDGSGYPRGLKADDIPETGRLTALCDVYDALVSHRVYRPALSQDEALGIMTKGRGQHFDPELFDLFLKTLPEFKRLRGITEYTFAPLDEVTDSATPAAP